MVLSSTTKCNECTSGSVQNYTLAKYSLLGYILQNLLVLGAITHIIFYGYKRDCIFDKLHMFDTRINFICSIQPYLQRNLFLVLCKSKLASCLAVAVAVAVSVSVSDLPFSLLFLGTNEYTTYHMSCTVCT